MNTATAPKLSKNGKRIGRPSSYTEKVAREICARVAAGQFLHVICRDEGMPEPGTVCDWRARNPEFEQMYARAKERQMEAMAEEIIEISDRADVDTYNPARLQVDTRKWLMSKLAPKKYGESTNVRLTDGEGGPVQFAVKSILDEAGALPAQPTTPLRGEPKQIER